MCLLSSNSFDTWKTFNFDKRLIPVRRINCQKFEIKKDDLLLKHEINWVFGRLVVAIKNEIKFNRIFGFERFEVWDDLINIFWKELRIGEGESN